MSTVSTVFLNVYFILYTFICSLHASVYVDIYVLFKISLSKEKSVESVDNVRIILFE